MSYVTKVQNIYDARATEPRLPAPIHRAADLRTDILLRGRSGKKGRLSEAYGPVFPSR